MNNVIESDKLILENRKKLNMTNVSSVDSYSEQVLKLSVGGSKVIINGEKLKIEAYNKSSGNLIVDGTINEIRFSVNKPTLVKRLFK